MLWFTLAMAASTNEEVLARIAADKVRAEGIVIDGRDDDWRGLYAMEGSGDVRAVSVAPTEDYLAVLVRLAPETNALRPVLVSLDSGGGHRTDIIFRIHGTTVYVNWHDNRRFGLLDGAASERRGPIAELRVAWSTLEAAAPEDHALHEGRSWVRVRAMLSRDDGQPRSEPLAVASYRLTFPPPPLDDPAPEPSVERLPGLLPLQGTWFVNQGAMSGSSHEGSWAYDLTVRDRSHRSRLGPNPEDSLAWGRPVVSPGRGRVRLAIDEHRDDALDALGDGDQANKVIVDLDDRTRFRVGHLQQHSVPVHAEQRVLPGTVLGRVGNSGKSSGPHAHVVYARADGTPAPVRLQGVTVGLNPTADDPWARTPEAGWEPRPGWFVTAAPIEPASPVLPAPLP